MLKGLAFGGCLFAMSIQCGGPATATDNFMPNNDLWKEDALFAVSNVDQETFNQIVQAGRDVYAPFAQENNEKLVINALWADATVNANCQRANGKVTVNMFGGLARRVEVRPEGFALVLCHELGHAYGGTPYIYTASKMSAEGQADYYSTFACYEKMAELLPVLKDTTEYSQYITEKCENKFSDEKSILNCMNEMNGGLSLGLLLSRLSQEPAPQLETPDPLIVKKTLTSYPATTQCRLDTYHNGALKIERPKCWFKN